MAGFLHMIIYIYNHMFYFTRIEDFLGERLTVKNLWELLTGNDGFGIIKIVAIVNVKDVLIEYLI